MSRVSKVLEQEVRGVRWDSKGNIFKYCDGNNASACLCSVARATSL